VANQDGNANYNAASWMPILTTVHKANQTITFGTAPSLTYLGSSGTLSATASSNLPVSFGTATPTVCTVSGTTVTPVAAGICNITADQAGDAHHSAASQVTQTITVAKANQTIIFDSAPSLTYNGATANVTATASSGLIVDFGSTTPTVCTVSGTTVTPVALGTCTITADQAGDANYNPAPQVTQNITVNKADQVITLGTAPNLTYLGYDGTLSATASSGLTVNFGTTTPTVCTVSGTTIAPVAVGICTITADQSGDANYNAAPQVTQNIVVNKANQFITVGDIPHGLLVQAPVTVSAVASSGLEVTFITLTPQTCQVSGTTVSVATAAVTTGTCRISAQQAGNENFKPAPWVMQTINIGDGSFCTECLPSRGGWRAILGNFPQ
ncbi:hypothetical protein TI04_09740, partial [Achromatium sp. WMS2]